MNAPENETGKLADAVLHLSSSVAQLKEAIRDLDDDLSDHDGRRAREFEHLRQQMVELDKAVALLHAKLDEARGQIRDVRDDLTPPHVALQDRRHDPQHERGLETITVAEAARFAWPIVKRLLPYLMVGGGGFGLWRLIDLLKGQYGSH